MKKQLNVAIDTSVYHQVIGRRDVYFKTLTRLATENKLHIHMPYFAVQECLYHSRDAYRDGIRKAKDELERLSKLVMPPQNEKSLQQVMRNLNSLDLRLSAFGKSQFTTWLKKAGVTVHPVNSNLAAQVIAAYYDGNPPYAQKKDRKDIPDAFIFHSLKNIALKTHPLHVVVGDKNLRKHCHNLPNVVVHPDLRSFIRDGCKEILRDERIEVNVGLLSGIMVVDGYAPDIDLESWSLDTLINKQVKSPLIPDDNQEATIGSLYAPDNVKFHTQHLEYFGHGRLGVPFSFDIDANLEYAVYKPDYCILDEEKADRISVSECNEHYFEAEELYTLLVSGLALIDIDEKVLADNKPSEDLLRRLVKSAEAEVDTSFEVEVVGEA